MPGTSKQATRIEIVIDAIDNFSKQFQEAAKSVDLFAARLDKLKTKYGDVAGAYAGIAAEVKNLKAQVADLNKALTNFSGADTQFARLAESMREAAGVFEEVIKGESEGAKAAKAFVKQTEEQEDVVKRATAAISRYGKIFLAMTVAQRAARYVRVMGSAVKDAAEEYAELEVQLRRVENITGATSAQIEILKNLLLSSRQAALGFAATDIAEPIFKFVQAGRGLEEIPDTLRTVSRFAVAVVTDFSAAMQTSLGLMASFDIEANRLGASFDTLTKAISSSRLSAEDLSQAIAAGGSAAKLTGQSLSSFLAALKSMRDLGIGAAQAGTTFKVAMLRLVDPPRKVAEELERFGVSLRDSAGQLKQWPELVAEFEKMMNSGQVSVQQFQAILREVFGQRGFRAMAASLAQGSESLKSWASSIENSAGITERFAQRSIESLRLRMDALQASFKNFKTIVGGDISPAFETLVETLASVIEWFNNLDESTRLTIETIVGAGGMLVAITALIGAFEALRYVIQAVTGVEITRMRVAFGTLGTIIGTLVIGALIRLVFWLKEIVRSMDVLYQLEQKIKTLENLAEGAKLTFKIKLEGLDKVRSAIQRIEDFQKALNDMQQRGVSMEDIEEATRNWLDANKDLRKEFMLLRGELGSVGETLDALKAKYIEQKDAAIEAAKAAKEQALAQLRSQISSMQEERRLLEERLAFYERQAKETQKVVDDMADMGYLYYGFDAGAAQGFITQQEAAAEAIGEIKEQLSELLINLSDLQDQYKEMEKFDVTKYFETGGKSAAKLFGEGLLSESVDAIPADEMAARYTEALQKAIAAASTPVSKEAYRKMLADWLKFVEDLKEKAGKDGHELGAMFYGALNAEAEKRLRDLGVVSKSDYDTMVERLSLQRQIQAAGELLESAEKERREKAKKAFEKTGKEIVEAFRRGTGDAKDLQSFTALYDDFLRRLEEGFGKESDIYQKWSSKRTEILLGWSRRLDKILKADGMAWEEYRVRQEKILSELNLDGDAALEYRSRVGRALGNAILRQFEAEARQIRNQYTNAADMYQALYSLSERYKRIEVEGYKDVERTIAQVTERGKAYYKSMTNAILAEAIRTSRYLDYSAAIAQLEQLTKKYKLTNTQIATLNNTLAALYDRVDFAAPLIQQARSIDEAVSKVNLLKEALRGIEAIKIEDPFSVQSVYALLRAYEDVIRFRREELSLVKQRAEQDTLPTIDRDRYRNEAAKLVADIQKIPEAFIKAFAELPPMTADVLQSLVSESRQTLDALLQGAEVSGDRMKYLNAEWAAAVAGAWEKSWEAERALWEKRRELGKATYGELLTVVDYYLAHTESGEQQMVELHRRLADERRQIELDMLDNYINVTGRMIDADYRALFAYRLMLQQKLAATKGNVEQQMQILEELRKVNERIEFDLPFQKLSNQIDIVNQQLSLTRDSFEALAEVDEEAFGDKRRLEERKKQLELIVTLYQKQFDLLVKQIAVAKSPLERTEAVAKAYGLYNNLINKLEELGEVQVSLSGKLGNSFRDFVAKTIGSVSDGYRQITQAAAEATGTLEETLESYERVSLSFFEVATRGHEEFMRSLELSTDQLIRAYIRYRDSLTGDEAISLALNLTTVMRETAEVLAGMKKLDEVDGAIRDLVSGLVESVRKVKEEDSRSMESVGAQVKAAEDAGKTTKDILETLANKLDDSSGILKQAASDLGLSSTSLLSSASALNRAADRFAGVVGGLDRSGDSLVSAARKFDDATGRSERVYDTSIKTLDRMFFEISNIKSVADQASSLMREGAKDVDQSLRGTAGESAGVLGEAADRLAKPAADLREAGTTWSEVAGKLEGTKGAMETTGGLVAEAGTKLSATLSATGEMASVVKQAAEGFQAGSSIFKSASEETSRAVGELLESERATASKMDDLVKTISALTGKLEGMLSEQTKITSGLKNVSSSLKSLKRDLSGIASSQDSISDALSGTSGKLDDIVGSFSTIVQKQDSSAERIERAVDELGAQLDATVQKQTDYVERVGAFVSDLNQLVSEFKSTASGFEESMGRALGDFSDNVNSTMTSLSDSHVSLERSFSSLLSQIADSISSFQAASDGAEKAAEAYGEVLARVEDMVGEVRGMVADLSTVERVSEAVRDLEEAVSAVERNISGSLQAQQGLSENIVTAANTLSGSIDGFSSVQESALADLRSAVDRVSDVTRDLGNTEERLLSDMQTTIAAFASDVGGIVSDLNESQSKLVSGLEGLVGKLDNLADGIQAAANASGDAAEKFGPVVSEIQSIADGLRTTVGELLGMTEPIESLKTELGAYSATIQSSSKEIGDSVGNLPTDLASLIAAQLSEVLGPLDSGVSGMTQAVETLKGALDGIDRLISSGVSEGVSGFSADVAELQTLFDTISTSTNELKEIVQSLPQGISGGVESGVVAAAGVLESALTDIVNRQQNVYDDVGALLTATANVLQNLEERIRDLTAQMPVDVKINVGRLQADISSIINEIRSAIRFRMA